MELKDVLKQWKFMLRLFMSGPYPALNKIDRQIERLCPDLCRRDCYYVEAGANDGVRQSNTYFLEKKYGARGLLIEPIPARFLEAKKNRSKRNCFSSVALIPFDFSSESVQLLYADLMTTADLGLQTDLETSAENHAEKGRKHMGKHDPVRWFAAPARTLTQLLDEAMAPEDIGLVSLDLEGNELYALMGIDFDKYRIRYFVIESRDHAKIDAYLNPRGYIRTHKLSDHDYLYSRDKSQGAAAMTERIILRSRG